MQPRLSSKHNAGMTLFEVGVVIAVIVVLAVLLLPMLHQAQSKAAKITCTGHLMQIGTACGVWESGHSGYFPMGIAVTNGGSMEMVQTGDVVHTFLVLSNELSTPFILSCPADVARSPANNFAGLNSTNVSYFISVDTTNNANPEMIIYGDCNFEIGGTRVKPGLSSFWTNDPVAWSATRHVKVGNLGMADGSVQSSTSAGLKLYLQQTGFATNRFAIP